MPILTPLVPQDFQSILDRYSLGKYQSHHHFSHALSNTVYLVKTTAYSAIIKLFEHERQDVINFQIKIMRALAKQGLGPRLYVVRKGREKGHVLSYYKKPLLVQEFFAGRHVRKLRNDEVRHFGTFLAQLHLSLRKLKGGSRWSKGYQFKHKKNDLKSLTLTLAQEFTLLEKNLKTIDPKTLPRGIIHGDLSSSNILQNKKGKIMLCDWDDAREDFLVYDIAVLIGNLMVKPRRIYTVQIKLFLDSYQKIRPLNKVEKKAIFFFILHSLLSGLEYASVQRKKHPEGKKDIEQWMRRQECKYTVVLKGRDRLL